MSTQPCCVAGALSAVLLAAPMLCLAQSATMPDNATQVPPEMGVKPARPGASAPLTEELQLRRRPELRPRMPSDEFQPDLRSEPRPEMSPGLQPNSQKPLRKEATTPGGGPPY